jgi:hypothetical protein
VKPVQHYDPPKQRHVQGEIAPHGTPTRYVQHKCRCQPCRDAIQAKEARSKRRRAYGMRSDWEDCLVDAAEAREHILTLAKHGFGAKVVERAAGVGHTALWEIRSGRHIRIFPGTRDRILGLTLSDLRAVKETATVPAIQTLRLVDEMVAAGFAKSWIARQIGQRTGGLQIANDFVFVRTARAIQGLHDRLWRENAEGWKGHRNGPGGKLYSGIRMRDACRCKLADDPKVIANREAKRRERARAAA